MKFTAVGLVGTVVGTLVGTLLTSTLLGQTYMEKRDNLDVMKKAIDRLLLPSDIQNSSTTSIQVQKLMQNKEYIDRPDLENEITTILNKQTATEQYYVVYGPKGVGKSVLISKCSDGKKGVVKVIISSVFEKRDILQELLTELLGEGSPVVTEKKMVDVLYKAKVDGRLPTLIFEIERGKDSEQRSCIESVRSLCKQFALCSNCIIILSETNAVLLFGKDPDREEIILVPELTQVQALEFIRARKGIYVDEKEMMHLFDNVGTNAAGLFSFLNKDMSVDEFIATKMADAKCDLVAFPIQPILRALEEHPEGVSPDYFNKEKCEGVDMSNAGAVGAVMKAAESNVVYLDMNRNIYKLNSHALEVALRSYTPIIYK